MSPLRRSGFLKNGFCMDDSTLEGLFCFDILHITDVRRSVFLWLLIPVFEALRSQAIGSLQQSYLFPLCVLWKHVLSDELDKIVLILSCFFFTNISFSGQYLRFCCVLVSALLSGVDEAVFCKSLSLVALVGLFFDLRDVTGLFHLTNWLALDWLNILTGTGLVPLKNWL